MILLDDRAGSRELYPIFLGVPKCPPIELTRLDFGDIQFMGHGPGDSWLSIGIEYKTINDVLNCITDGRFAGHQLPGCLQSFDIVYLLVEGNYSQRASDGGLFISGRRSGRHQSGISYMQLNGWLTSMEQTGLHIRQTDKKEESAAVVLAIYNWWQKPWDKHESLKAVHSKPQPARDMETASGIQLLRAKPNLVERFAAQITGFGFGKAEDVAKHFKTVFAAVNATEEEWKKVAGVGEVLAEKAVKSIRGE